MFKALDETGALVHIDSANRTSKYYCEICENEVVMKMGDIRRHHFAHQKDTFCKDTWHYDMSDWHFEWQNRFPVECQEIVKEYNGKRHRADVLIEKKKIVIEFQHSNLSSKEFDERNVFYNALGYKVIWIFDAIASYNKKEIENYDEQKWSWKRPRKTLDNYDYKNKNIEVYLQLSDEPDDEYIIKVVWCPKDNGFSRFVFDGKCYFYNDFTTLVNENNVNATYEFKLKNLYDVPLYLFTKDHAGYYFGCPISSTHICMDNKHEISQNMYKEIMPCEICEFLHFHKEGYRICKKRFADLKLSQELIVKIESKNNYGFINKISYIENDKLVFLEIPTYEPRILKSLLDLWNPDYTAATFRNVCTDVYVRLYQDPNIHYKKYGKVYGYLSKGRDNKYSYQKNTFEIYRATEKEWVCEWSRTKKQKEDK